MKGFVPGLFTRARLLNYSPGKIVSYTVYFYVKCNVKKCNVKISFKDEKSSVRKLKRSITVLHDCRVGIRYLSQSFLLNKLFKMINRYSVF